MYPIERSLVKRLANKPFALLGINSDDDREELKKILDKESITWLNWWDDGRTDGPIHTKWQITERPAIFLIDAEGIIRYRDVDEDKLQDTIDSMLKEINDKTRKP